MSKIEQSSKNGAFLLICPYSKNWSHSYFKKNVSHPTCLRLSRHPKMAPFYWFVLTVRTGLIVTSKKCFSPHMSKIEPASPPYSLGRISGEMCACKLSYPLVLPSRWRMTYVKEKKFIQIKCMNSASVFFSSVKALKNKFRVKYIRKFSSNLTERTLSVHYKDQ